MSTEYKVADSGDGVEIEAIEHSGVFNLDVFLSEETVDKLSQSSLGFVTAARSVTPEELAEIGINLLRAALYNVADHDEFKRWLHVRLDEATFSSERTSFDEFEKKALRRLAKTPSVLELIQARKKGESK